MTERYRLTRHVATGGMAEVFVGVARGAEGFEKKVAVKRMLPHLTKNPSVARMFLSEARLATHLNHQNIVQVLDVSRGDDGLYIVMELVDGWDLSQVLERLSELGARVPPPLAAFIASQVAAGLSHAYRKTLEGRPIVVAHRDVSPANILLSAEGEVKVADFGIARLDATSTGTDPGTFKGKLAYASPEVLKGQSATAASDQFSLGVALYEMVAGRHPFGDVEPLSDFLQRLQTGAPASLDLAAPGLSPVVATALEKDPARRYPTTEAFSRALAEYLARAGEPATSAELAAFLAQLGLPPPFGERPGEEVARKALVPQGFGSLELTPSLAPADPGAFELDPDWHPQGPTLDASGRLVGAASPADETAPLPPVTAEPAWVAPTAPRFAPPSEPELPLVLEHQRAPQEVAPETFGELPEPARGAVARIGRAVMLLLTLGAAGAFALLVLWPRLAPLLKDPRVPAWVREAQTKVEGLRPAPAILYIDSEPSGATIKVEGQTLGQTPLVQENHYAPDSEVQVELTLPGHKPYHTQFRGGAAAEIRARLQRR